jgi:hypothetical protein
MRYVKAHQSFLDEKVKSLAAGLAFDDRHAYPVIS